MGESNEKKTEGCPLCDLPEDRAIAQNDLAFVIRDRHPVTPLHTLVIPHRHVSGFFDLETSEMKDPPEAWRRDTPSGRGEAHHPRKRRLLTTRRCDIDIM